MANFQKYTLANVKTLLSHCNRTNKDYKNENIDKERTYMNYNLHNLNNKEQKEKIDKAIEKGKQVGRFNKTTNAVVGLAITYPKELCNKKEKIVNGKKVEYYTAKDKREMETFFKQAYEFNVEKFGKENVISANIHLDETTPHMHFLFLPRLENGQFNAKKIINKNMLKTYHRELQASLDNNTYYKYNVMKTNQARNANKYGYTLQELKLYREIERQDNFKETIWLANEYRKTIAYTYYDNYNTNIKRGLPLENIKNSLKEYLIILDKIEQIILMLFRDIRINDEKEYYEYQNEIEELGKQALKINKQVYKEKNKGGMVL